MTGDGKTFADFYIRKGGILQLMNRRPRDIYSILRPTSSINSPNQPLQSTTSFHCTTSRQRAVLWLHRPGLDYTARDGTNDATARDRCVVVVSVCRWLRMAEVYWLDRPNERMGEVACGGFAASSSFVMCQEGGEWWLNLLKTCLLKTC